MYFASMEITRTFAPAFGKEAAMLDRMLQRRLARCAPDGLRLRSRLSQERPKRTALPPAAFEKKLRKKTSRNVWRFETNSLPLHPLLGRTLRSSAPKKTSKKVPQKFGGYAKNSLPLQPLSLKTEGVKKERSLMRFT